MAIPPHYQTHPYAHRRFLDSPPLRQTRLLAGEYVFDAETASDIALAEEVAGMIDVYLYWRDAWAIVASRRATRN